MLFEELKVVEDCPNIFASVVSIWVAEGHSRKVNSLYYLHGNKRYTLIFFIFNAVSTYKKLDHNPFYSYNYYPNCGWYRAVKYCVINGQKWKKG
jgi:hypothetical protein